MDRREQAEAAWAALTTGAGRERWRTTVVAEGPWRGRWWAGGRATARETADAALAHFAAEDRLWTRGACGG